MEIKTYLKRKECMNMNKKNMGKNIQTLRIFIIKVKLSEGGDSFEKEVVIILYMYVQYADFL